MARNAAVKLGSLDEAAAAEAAAAVTETLARFDDDFRAAGLVGSAVVPVDEAPAAEAAAVTETLARFDDDFRAGSLVGAAFLQFLLFEARKFGLPVGTGWPSGTHSKHITLAPCPSSPNEWPHIAWHTLLHMRHEWPPVASLSHTGQRFSAS